MEAAGGADLRGPTPLQLHLIPGITSTISLTGKTPRKRRSGERGRRGSGGGGGRTGGAGPARGGTRRMGQWARMAGRRSRSRWVERVRLQQHFNEADDDVYTTYKLCACDVCANYQLLGNAGNNEVTERI